MATRSFAAFAVTGALMVLGCGHSSSPIRAAAAPPSAGALSVSAELADSGQISTAPLEVSTAAVTIRTSGKAGFNEEHLSYVSSPLEGRVVEVLVRPGEEVQAGQTLAVIDSPALGEAWSDYAKARADQVLAEHGYKLAQDLSQLRALPGKELQKAADDLTKAKADLRRTRERLVSLGFAASELDVPLDDLHVRSHLNLTAPIAGTVIERNLTLGQTVGGEAAQRLFVVADLGILWVTADVYEKDLSLVHDGDPVRVEAAAWPDKRFEGRVEYIGSTVDANTHTVKVRAAVDNRELLLKPEMFVTATLESNTTAQVMSVPLAAVHGEGSGQPYVFVGLDGNRYARRAVVLGARNGDRVAVTSGLAPDERVVTNGSILLKAENDRQARG